MSGTGLVSVRLPLSLLAALESAARRIGVHHAVVRLLAGLVDLSPRDLLALPDPPRGPAEKTLRVSFYVHQPGVDALVWAVRATKLSRSRILRRVLHALLVAGSLRLVFSENKNRFALVAVQNHHGTAVQSAIATVSCSASELPKGVA